MSETEPLPSVASVVAGLRAAGVELPAGRVTLDRYGDSPELSRGLLALIREGGKRAGTSLLWALEADAEPVPEAGDIAIVLDHRDRPALVTRVLEARVVPFRDVTAAYARIEGEGDGSLEYWRRTHRDFFARECGRIGREPAEDMAVVCCVFALVRDLGA